jgi:alpha-N-arabinofuranosidase
MADKNDPVKELPINKTPREYVDFYLQCKAAIDEVAPGTKLGVIGLHDTGNIGLNKHPDWMKTVLGELGDKIDFIDLHNGYAPAIRASGVGLFARVYPDDEFAECFMGASVYVRDNIEQTKAIIAQFAPDGGKNIELQITEYGPLVYPIVPKRMMQDAAWNRSLCGALYQACLFNVLLAEPKLTSANHLPLCQDVFGALIGIRGAYPQRQTWRNIVYHVVQMYSAMQNREVLQAEVTAPTYSTRAMGIVPKMQDVPYVDAGAYRTADGKQLTLFLVNRNAKRDALVQVDPGFEPSSVESIKTLTADTYLAENSPENPDNVVPRTTAAPQTDQTRLLNLTLRKHSLTVVTFSNAK